MRPLQASAFGAGFLGLMLVIVHQSDRPPFMAVDALAGASKSKKGRAPPASRAGSSSGSGFGSKKAPNFVHTRDDAEATHRLLQFLAAQNARGLENVDVGFHDETRIRGLFCTTDVKKGQLICQIPSDCVIALSDPSMNGDDAPTVAHGGANLLQMYMHHEQHKQLWAPYLDTLPVYGSDQFDPTPDYFIDDDLELLEFPRIIQMARDRKAQIQTVAAERGLADVDELQFATWLTSSRAFRLSLAAPSPPPPPRVDDDGGDDNENNNNNAVMPKHDEKGQVIIKAQQKVISVLIPFIDLANHSSDQPNCKLTMIDPEKDEAWFALEATRPIAAGKELVIAYGNGVESTVDLLLDYGFVPSSNRIDPIMLKKGGDDCIENLDGWTTTLEEDRTVLEMAKDDPVLQKILRFRIRLKESYKA